MSRRDRIRDRGLGILFVTLFLVSWVGQLVAEWFDYRNEQHTHGAPATFWSADFWTVFWQSTLENWQSEFLQLAAFVIATAYFVYKGSAASGDADRRIEAKLDALLRETGLDPERIERRLRLKHRSMPSERESHRDAWTAG